MIQMFSITREVHCITSDVNLITKFELDLISDSVAKTQDSNLRLGTGYSECSFYSEIWGSHSDNQAEYHLVGCYAR